MITHAGSPVAESLKIMQPLAVKEADVKLVSAKSQTAVEPSKTGVTLVKFAPPAEYADPDAFEISFVAL